jgi:hypothetical protein
MGVQVGFFRRSAKPPVASDPPPLPAPDPAVLAALAHPDYIPPEPIDYGGHRDEVDDFVASVGLMNRAEVARVQRQAAASGVRISARWTDVVAALDRVAAEHGLEIGRVAAHHRADKASRSSPGRFGNDHAVADYAAGMWAEVLVLRDHLDGKTVRTVFEPWDGVLEPADWMDVEANPRLD